MMVLCLWAIDQKLNHEHDYFQSISIYKKGLRVFTLRAWVMVLRLWVIDQKLNHGDDYF